MAREARAAISWSAGKDSCLALMEARASGLDVATFVTMCDTDGLSKSHALPPALIAAQVDALGGAWWPVAVSSLSDAVPSYATVFDATLARLRATDHTHLVFGDIDLAAHRDWLEPRCRAAGLAAVFPLWGRLRATVARDVIACGVRARVVVIDTSRLDAAFCGADYDDAFLAALPDDVCPCGENGEFHTFVHGGPGFERALAIGRGVPRRVASAPPFTPTEFVFEAPVLIDGVHR